MDAIELCYMPALELGKAIRAKQVSPVEVVDAVLARIERLNPTLNAYCTVTAAAARAAAKAAEAAVMRGDALGALHGIPVSIKDLVATKGVRTTHGSKLYEQFIPDEDAPVVERLKRAGAIILGKTNTPEFGHKAITDNLIFGPSRNPWSLEHTPGGSSGGAAAAVATGLGPLAVGTDAAGSIRIPSSCCAIFGLKPTLGLVAMAPTYGGLETLSHTGPMTRTVRDAALMLSAMVGAEPKRSELPAGRRNRLSRWPQPGRPKAACGVESRLGICACGPGRATNHRGSGETVYRSGLPCGGGTSRLRRPSRDLSESCQQPTAPPEWQTAGLPSVTVSTPRWPSRSRRGCAGARSISSEPPMSGARSTMCSYGFSAAMISS